MNKIATKIAAVISAVGLTMCTGIQSGFAYSYGIPGTIDLCTDNSSTSIPCTQYSNINTDIQVNNTAVTGDMYINVHYNNISGVENINNGLYVNDSYIEGNVYVYQLFGNTTYKPLPNILCIRR